MKNSINVYGLLLTSLFLCSFQTTSSMNIQEIFQEALLTKQLSDVFEKDSNGQLLPLTLITNQLVSDKLHLKYDGKSVNISEENKEQAIALELTGVKIKSKKSILEFKYQNKTIKIRLKKDNNQWRAYTISIKRKGTISISTFERTEF